MNADYSVLVGKEIKFAPNQPINDYKCAICKKVAIDCQSSNCGCIFCRHCIEEYLRDGDRRCPGNTGFCTILNLSADITNDPVSKRRIGKLDVSCVFGCGKAIKFDALLDHIRVCDQGVLDCPYKSIGCGASNIMRKDLQTHMQLAALDHAEIFVNWMNQVENNFNLFRTVGTADSSSASADSSSNWFQEKQLDLENRTNTSFTWTIYGYKAHFERGREHPEYFFDSEPIYLSGYCFLLRFYPYYFFPANECYYVALKYAVRKGKYDDKLKWPVTKKIHLGILKPRCGSVYNSKCSVTSEMKPTSDSPTFSDHFGLAHCKFVNDLSKDLQVNDDLKFTISID